MNADGAPGPLRYRDRCALRKSELSLALERFVGHCATKPDVTRIIVFGSYARDHVLVVRDPASGVPRDLVDDLYRGGKLGGDILAVRSTSRPAIPTRSASPMRRRLTKYVMRRGRSHPRSRSCAGAAHATPAIVPDVPMTRDVPSE